MPSSASLLTRADGESRGSGRPPGGGGMAAEVEKHSIEEQKGIHLGAEVSDPTDLAVVLGGDGSILTALRAYAGRGVPVFGFNFGAIGFLATLEPHRIDEALAIAFEGRFELLEPPGIAASVGGDGRR